LVRPREAGKPHEKGATSGRAVVTVVLMSVHVTSNLIVSLYFSSRVAILVQTPA